MNEFLKKRDVVAEKHESQKKTESTEKVINLENGEEQPSVFEESKGDEVTKKLETEDYSAVNWFERLNFSGSDELVDVTDLKPLYQVRKDTSNKKNVLVSVRTNYPY